jgi:hypothetical protein
VITKQDEEMLDIYDLDEYFPKRKVAVLIRKRKYLSPAASGFLKTIKPGIRFTKQSPAASLLLSHGDRQASAAPHTPRAVAVGKLLPHSVTRSIG